MRRFAIIVGVLAVGCADEPSAPATCNPVLALDDLHRDVSEMLDAPADGTSYCLRLDATTITRPHLEVTTPFSTAFQLDLLDLDQTTIATGADVVIGSTTSTTLVWDPAGGEVFDVLVRLAPRPPAFGGSVVVAAQLSDRP